MNFAISNAVEVHFTFHWTGCVGFYPLLLVTVSSNYENCAHRWWESLRPFYALIGTSQLFCELARCHAVANNLFFRAQKVEATCQVNSRGKWFAIKCIA